MKEILIKMTLAFHDREKLGRIQHELGDVIIGDKDMNGNGGDLEELRSHFEGTFSREEVLRAVYNTTHHFVSRQYDPEFFKTVARRIGEHLLRHNGDDSELVEGDGEYSKYLKKMLGDKLPSDTTFLRQYRTYLLAMAGENGNGGNGR